MSEKPEQTGAVFLSASVPDPRRDPKYHRTANVMATRSAITGLVTAVLGRRVLVWGGHPSITPIIKIVAESNQVDYGRWVKLYQSRYFEADFPADNRHFKNVTYTKRLGNRDRSVALMRDAMFKQPFSAAVFIGGMEGVEEEFKLLREAQPACRMIPVASTGAAAALIYARGEYHPRLADDLAYVSVFRELLQLPNG